MEAMDDMKLWYACAGSMVRIPQCNEMVYYFPQGHAEHSSVAFDFEKFPRIPSCVLCRVGDVRFMADLETDEVFAKIRLIPVKNDEKSCSFRKNQESANGVEVHEKPTPFAKTLTQSDANNGGGFSVPRYCAETIFPPLDYEADPPVQNVLAKDVHGKLWEFRHIYRGTPRRHLLTTGWSTFVNQKKLVAGDSIVFLRSADGQLCVGIRRAKRGHDSGKGKVRPECIIEAATLAANFQPFEVVYYPGTSTPEFFVKAKSVREAMQLHWSSGMRIKMAFETEDLSRISWFMGIVSCVRVMDPIRWPDSPWKLLQVTWEESDLLQNVKSVSPWLVELVPSMPFSPPWKKLRSNFPYDSQFSVPSFQGNSLGPNSFFYSLSNEIPSCSQEFGHAQFSVPTPFTNIHLNNQSGFFHTIPAPLMVSVDSDSNNEDEFLELNTRKPAQEKTQFVLFGKSINIAHHVMINTGVSTSPILNGNNSSDSSSSEDDSKQETRHCKVFIESEDIGRTLDLSALGSYEELYRKLANMFDVEPREMLSRALYCDETGAVKYAGEEPFTKFVNTAKRLTIPMDVGRF